MFGQGYVNGERDLYNAFKLVLVVLKVVGLNPHSKNETTRIALQIYSCILPIFNLIYGVFVVCSLKQISPDWYKMSKIFLYLSISNHVIGYAAYLTAVRICVFNQKKILNEMKNLRNVDRMLHNNGFTFYYNSKNHNWMIMVLLGCIPVIFILDFMYFTPEGVIELVAVYLPLLMIHVADCQWYCFVKSLGDHYIFTTQILEETISRIHFPLSVFKVQQLAIVHLKLHKIGRNFNEVFGPFTCISVTYVFLVSTSHMFYTVVSGTSDIMEILTFVAISSCRFLGLWAVVSSSERASTEAERFNVAIHKLTQMDHTGDTSRDEKIFLHLLMKNKITFSASGFFSLDYSLMQTMAGHAATFLVILIQFFLTRDKV